jgi:iron complex outermembrane receptor protein
MKQKYRIILTTALLFVIFPLHAQMAFFASDTLNLDEILITGNKAKAINRKDINGKVLALQNPHDGGEIFINQPGFGVLKKGNYAMEPVLRGFKYEQLNVQFDGGVHSVSACPNRMDPAISQISIEDIERVEVIYGPYSVRFGPVFGGIINVVSKRPQVTLKAFSGSVDGGYQTNGNNFYSDLFAQVVKKKFDFSVNAGYKDYGNYKSGSGETIASSFRRTGYTTRLGYNISEKQRVQLTWRQSFARDVLYAGLPMDADEDNSSILSLDYGIQNISGTIFSLKVKIYGSSVTHLMTNKRRPSYKFTHATTPVEAQTFGGRIEIGISTGARNILYAGMDFQYIGKNGSRERVVYINACTGAAMPNPKTFYDKVWQDSQKNDLGLFIENKFSISKSLDWLTGLRVDGVNYAINDPEDDFYKLYNGNIKPENRFVPEITTSLSWRPAAGLSVQLAMARAERTPGLEELFINHLSVGMDAYEYVGNPNLKPEVNYQADLRVENKWKKVDVFADVFVSFLQDYITARVDTTIPRKFMPCKLPKYTKKFTNIDKAFKTGFEAGITWQLAPHFIYDLSASYTFARNKTWDEPLPEIPPFTAVSGLTFKTKKLDTRLTARMASAQNRVSQSFDESATPGYAVFDWYFNYQVAKFMEVRASVTNIFNKNYVEHLSRPYKNMDISSLYYEPGVSFNVGVKFGF